MGTTQNEGVSEDTEEYPVFGCNQKEEESGENCIVSSFMICTSHQLLLGRSNLGGREMDEAFDTCLREKKCVQTWREKPEGKSRPARRSHRDGDNINTLRTGSFN